MKEVITAVLILFGVLGFLTFVTSFYTFPVRDTSPTCYRVALATDKGTMKGALCLEEVDPSERSSNS